MSESSKPLFSSLEAGEERAFRDMCFSIKCKNEEKIYSYNLGGRPSLEKFEEVTKIFALALYKMRHRHGHVTRETIMTAYWKFLSFLDEIKIYTPGGFDKHTLTRYAEWMKSQPGLSYTTAASQYRTLRPVFIQMSKHEEITSDFKPVKNAFPKSSSLQAINVGYDQGELKDIIKAAVKEMREVVSKFGNVYVPTWIGKPPPLSDVATKTPNQGFTICASPEYKIWWWENKCNCKPLTVKELRRMPQGETFISNCSGNGIKGMAGVDAFYKSIGAYDNYTPRYLGAECPIKYRTPWKKIDYLVWYWENELNCAVLSYKKLKKLSPQFCMAMSEYFQGDYNWFYERLGITRWVSGRDLVPFYIMLLVRTQLNPSTIQRLTTHCVVPDPLNEEKKILSFTKFRANKSGQTIPSNASQSEWPVNLVNKVIKITSTIRQSDQNELWVTNTNHHRVPLPLGRSGLKMCLKEFSIRNDIRDSEGNPMVIHASLIRPTMAWSEYLRTEDMLYLQTLLGHEKIWTTANYLRRLSDPVFLMNRAIHQDALFLGLTEASNSSNKSVELLVADGLLNHCSDPNHSPIAGQIEGAMCTAGHEVCLGCPNIVITVSDIKKFFCFIAYYEQLRNDQVISDSEYLGAVDEKKFMWENYILPRYTPDVVRAAYQDAKLNPIEIWSLPKPVTESEE